jgi:hypothetical protein
MASANLAVACLKRVREQAGHACQIAGMSQRKSGPGQAASCHQRDFISRKPTYREPLKIASVHASTGSARTEAIDF